MKSKKNPKSRKPIIPKSGFTLLELLVVISIIGILIALGTVSYSTAQKKTRDAKRKADIKSIQNGMEQYFSQSNRYSTTPEEVGTMFSGALPTDPKTGAAYDYGFDTVAPVGEGYCACATLEISNSGNAYGRSGTTCTFTSGTGTKDYFCVQNLQ